MRRPRIGYARLLSARNVPNYSTIMDILSVITLGQVVKQPLIGSPSELSDGLEPHDYIYSAVHPHVASVQPCHGPAGVYPGLVQVGYWEGGIPGTVT